MAILSCKAYDLPESIAAIGPAVAGGATVLPILNGLAHYDALDAAAGRERVAGGLCHIFSTLGPEGEIVVMGKIHRLTFGERGVGPGQFWLPGGIFVHGPDRIYVADSYNQRIQIFEYLAGGGDD